RHPDTEREPLPKRAGGNFDPRQARRWMAFEVAGELSQSLSWFGRESARFSPRRVKQRSGVALGKNNTIVQRVLWVRDVKSHRVKKDGRCKVGGRHTACRVS